MNIVNLTFQSAIFRVSPSYGSGPGNKGPVRSSFNPLSSASVLPTRLLGKGAAVYGGVSIRYLPRQSFLLEVLRRMGAIDVMVSIRYLPRQSFLLAACGWSCW